MATFENNTAALELNLIEGLKLGRSKPITSEEAYALAYPSHAHDMNNIDGVVECKNVEYRLEKVGKKGSLYFTHSQDNEIIKAENGLFEIVLCWDYIHPTNFCQNKSGLKKRFLIVL